MGENNNLGPKADEGDAERAAEREKIEQIQSLLRAFDMLQGTFSNLTTAAERTSAEGRRCILSISDLKYHQAAFFFEVTGAMIRQVPQFERYTTHIAAPIDSVVRVLKGVLDGDENAGFGRSINLLQIHPQRAIEAENVRPDRFARRVGQAYARKAQNVEQRAIDKQAAQRIKEAVGQRNRLIAIEDRRPRALGHPHKEVEHLALARAGVLHTDHHLGAQALEDAHLLRDSRTPTVVLGRGEMSVALKVRAHRVSAGAKAKIEKAGGTVELIA